MYTQFWIKNFAPHGTFLSLLISNNTEKLNRVMTTSIFNVFSLNQFRLSGFSINREINIICWAHFGHMIKANDLEEK